MAKAKQSTVTEAAPAAEAEARICGCGQCGLTVTKGRNFRQGHDARRKSILIAALEEGQGAMAEELIHRGWMGQAEWDDRLGRRFEERAAKQAKAKVKAEKAAEREADKQARAEAKAKVAKPEVEEEA